MGYGPNIWCANAHPEHPVPPPMIQLYKYKLNSTLAVLMKKLTFFIKVLSNFVQKIRFYGVNQLIYSYKLIRVDLQ